MMKIFLILLCLSIGFSGCRILNDRQIQSIKCFNEAANEFSQYPSKILIELTDLRELRGVYFANSLQTPELHITELDSIFSQKKYDENISKKVDLSFKILSNYSSLLGILISDRFNEKLNKNTDALGLELDKCIQEYNVLEPQNQLPGSLSNSATDIILLSGNLFIKHKQYKIISNVIPRSDSAIKIITNNMINYLEDSYINQLIEIEKVGITSNYLSFLLQNKSYPDNDLVYLNMKERIYNVEIAKNITIEAIHSIATIHNKIAENLLKKNSLEENIKEFQKMQSIVNSLRKNLMQL